MLQGDGALSRTLPEVKEHRLSHELFEGKPGEVQCGLEEVVWSLNVGADMANHADVVHDVPLTCEPDDLWVDCLSPHHLDSELSPSLSGCNHMG